MNKKQRIKQIEELYLQWRISKADYDTFMLLNKDND